MSRSSQIPSKKACLELLKQHRVPQHILLHSLKVNKVALYIGRHLNKKGQEIDLEALEASALLHDITKIDGIRKGQNHAHTGALLLRRLGYPKVADIVEQHIILKDYKGLARITEEEILNYADKRVQHERIVTLKERFSDLQERYGKGAEAEALIGASEERTRSLEKKIFSKLDIDPLDLLKL